MVNDAFLELNDWFAGLLNPIQTEYQRGMTDGHSRTETMLRLSKLAGQVTGMKDMIEGYVNVDLNPKPRIILPDYDLPSSATTLNDAKTPADQRLKAPKMIAKAFEGLNPWFQSFFCRIKPYYSYGLKAEDEPLAAKIRLKGLVTQVNMIKLLLLEFVNEEIKRKEHGASFSAGAEDNAEEVQIPDDVGLEIVKEILDIKISDEPLPEVDDSPKFDLGGDEEE